VELYSQRLEDEELRVKEEKRNGVEDLARDIVLRL